MNSVSPVKVISREEWEGNPPNDNPPFKGPVKYVVISYETPTIQCHSQEECLTAVKELYKLYVIDGNLPDIPFNFLIGGDGSIFEARGFKTEPSRSIPYFKDSHGNRIDIAFLGDYSGKTYTMEMMTSCDQIITTGVLSNYIETYYEPLIYVDDYKILESCIKGTKHKPWYNWEIQEMADGLYGKEVQYEVAADRMYSLILKKPTVQF